MIFPFDVGMIHMSNTWISSIGRPDWNYMVYWRAIKGLIGGCVRSIGEQHATVGDVLRGSRGSICIDENKFLKIMAIGH